MPKMDRNSVALVCALTMAGWTMAGLGQAPETKLTPQVVTDVCAPKILVDKEVVSAAQRKTAGNRAWPPLTDAADGFAWPDTELGVIKGDGGYHARQLWEGEYFGNDKYGSITRTIGTLDNPLGTEPPIDVTIHANPDPSVNPFYASYD